MKNLDREALLGLAERYGCREIYKCLCGKDKVKTKQLIKETGMSPRTVKRRVSELEKVDVVEVCYCKGNGGYSSHIKDSKAAMEFGKMIRKFEVE